MARIFNDVVTIGYVSMTPFELATPIILLSVLAGVGGWSARRDWQAYLGSLRRGCYLTAVLLLPGALLVGWFVNFDPDTIKSLGTSPAQQTGWLLAMSLFGAGVSMLAGIGAYGIGGWLWGRHRNVQKARLLIAIDGPAASGKGTLAKRLADRLGIPSLDTGLLYRAVARDVASAGHALEDVAAAVAAAKSLDAESLSDPDLRGPRAGDAASIVAKIPEVRAALLEYQRTFASRDRRGAILDGRDIGTVVCPDADIKIFVTASDEARAHRRHLEHQARGEEVAYEVVLEDLRRRDARDKGRSVAPLEAAPDALLLDTTLLDPDQTLEAAIKLIERASGRKLVNRF